MPSKKGDHCFHMVESSSDNITAINTVSDLCVELWKLSEAIATDTNGGVIPKRILEHLKIVREYHPQIFKELVKNKEKLEKLSREDEVSYFNSKENVFSTLKKIKKTRNTKSENTNFIKSVNNRYKLEYDLNYNEKPIDDKSLGFFNAVGYGNNIAMIKAEIDVLMALQKSKAVVIPFFPAGEEPKTHAYKKQHKIIDAMITICYSFSKEKGMERASEYKEIYSLLLDELWSQGIDFRFFKRVNDLLSQYELPLPRHQKLGFEDRITID
jgi:hypothetical protein